MQDFNDYTNSSMVRTIMKKSSSVQKLLEKDEINDTADNVVRDYSIISDNK